MLRMLSRFLGRLSVGRKLILIFLLDMSAVAYISGILVNEKFIAIDFARKELAGNSYIAELRAPLLATAAAVADGQAVNPETLNRIESAEKSYGLDMGSAQPSQELMQSMRTLAASPQDVVPARAALDKGRALVTRVGNQSNLILDPDLDSYYTMSIILLRLPELTQAAAEIGAHQLRRGALAGNTPKTAFLLLEGRFDAGWQGLESDYREAFAAGSPTLRAALEPSRKRLQNSVEEFRAAARRAMESDSYGQRQALALAHADLQTQLDTAWRTAGTEMEALLEARVNSFFTRMWMHLGTALGLLALILTAVFFVARQIALPLKRLSHVADEVGRTGDRTLRATWHSSDEIGRLVIAFNDMLDELDRERAAQQELTARARATQAQMQLVEAIPIPLMVTAIPGHQVLHANKPAQSWLNGTTTDPWRRGMEPAVRSRFFQQLADRDAVDEFEVRWNAGNNDASWAVLSARQLEFQGQNAVLTAFTPINHLKLMERRLELWAKVFEASSEGILIIDSEQRVLTANRAFCRSTGYELHDLIGEPLHASGSTSFAATFGPVLQSRSNWQGEVLLHRRDGTSFPAWLMISVVRDGAHGQVAHCIATIIDITDRKRNEERIRFLAQHDVLTELPNRALCIERLRMAMQQASRRNEKVAVMFIDLDRFKNINDSLGHHVGDGLLRSVGRRLSELVRTGDTVSRLGGDEFVVVLSGVSDAHEVASIVDERLMPGVRGAHDIDGAELQVSCSMGIAMYPDDSDDLDTLMRHADAAMYQAKSQGRDGAQFFSEELNERAQHRMSLESNLRHALERGELTLHYQPRVDASTRRVLGVEALLRWHCAELGHVSPAQFIGIAEETRLIVPIGAWVIAEACRQLSVWRAMGLDIPQVSVNVSALQLRDDSLFETLRAALDRHALPPGTVELELTESTLMDNVEQTLERLGAIKRLGVELAIDDFGTGYSSLNYLNRVPIDRLKIDRTFVRDMCEDPTDLAITKAIIGLGHTLGLKVVAEGVESEREAQTLRASGCDELQGFLIARPMSGEMLTEWVGRPRMLKVV